MARLWAIAILSAALSGAGYVSTPAPQNLQQIQQQIDRGQTAEALRRLDALAATTPVPEGVHRLQGKAFYAADRFAEADTAFTAALAQNPKDLESTQMRGLTLFRLGKPGEAIPLLLAAHDWTPETRVDPSYVLALCYLDAHRYDDARHAFGAQYGFPPDSAAAYLLAARMLLRRDYLPVAQDFAQKALAIDPQLPLAHALLGEIALAGNHLDVAVAEFERERTRNPLDGAIYDRLGDAYSRAGNYQQALQSLQRAVILEPNVTAPFILLGKVLLKQEAPANAVMYLEHAVAMDPGNYMTHSLLGQAYRSLGRAEDASRETQTAQRLQAKSDPKLQNVK
ncbi:tetratricopeptide repeat protein [Granulicella arctica]|uniref:tetratricopeptide repeat protein n=1 Tax=Granulicella arctica TaxID=940613 RepID=UPI0021E082EF|nr:tetratricopeptide repeat protein [Granulicella arctica]